MLDLGAAIWSRKLIGLEAATARNPEATETVDMKVQCVLSVSVKLRKSV